MMSRIRHAAMWGTSLLIAFLFASVVSAAEKPIIIQWDASNLQLSWKSIKDGKTKVNIDLINRKMCAGKKCYPISEEESAQMTVALYRFVSEYAIVSEDWFERGGVYPEPKPKHGKSGNIARR